MGEANGSGVGEDGMPVKRDEKVMSREETVGLEVSSGEVEQILSGRPEVGARGCTR